MAGIGWLDEAAGLQASDAGDGGAWLDDAAGFEAMILDTTERQQAYLKKLGWGAFSGRRRALNPRSRHPKGLATDAGHPNMWDDAWLEAHARDMARYGVQVVDERYGPAHPGGKWTGAHIHHEYDPEGIKRSPFRLQKNPYPQRHPSAIESYLDEDRPAANRRPSPPAAVGRRHPSAIENYAPEDRGAVYWTLEAARKFPKALNSNDRLELAHDFLTLMTPSLGHKAAYRELLALTKQGNFDAMRQVLSAPKTHPSMASQYAPESPARLDKQEALRRAQQAYAHGDQIKAGYWQDVAAGIDTRKAALEMRDLYKRWGKGDPAAKDELKRRGVSDAVARLKLKLIRGVPRWKAEAEFAEESVREVHDKITDASAYLPPGAQRFVGGHALGLAAEAITIPQKVGEESKVLLGQGVPAYDRLGAAGNIALDTLPIDKPVHTLAKRAGQAAMRRFFPGRNVRDLIEQALGGRRADASAPEGTAPSVTPAPAWNIPEPARPSEPAEWMPWLPPKFDINDPRTNPFIDEAPTNAPAQNPSEWLEEAASGTALTDAHGYRFTELRADPKKVGVFPGLQYKKVGIVDPENAVTEQYKGVGKYDQGTAGPWSVWETKDGQWWVVNGHHRREIAVRTGEPDVPIRLYREADGIDFRTARAIGALQNIRDGKGTAIDAATVIRDMGYTRDELQGLGVNTRSAIGRDALGLLRLGDDALRMVEEGDVAEPVAAAIGEAGLPPVRQVAALRQAAKRGLETRTQGQLLAELARDAPIVERADEGSLFGDVEQDLALAEQAEIAAAAMGRLTQDERLLKAITRGTAVGDTVVDEAAQLDAAALQEIARKVIATDPDVSSVLQREAVSYANRPTKGQLDLAVRKVVESARRAADRRLAELRPNARGAAQSADAGVRARGDGELPRQPANEESAAQLDAARRDGPAPRPGWEGFESDVVVHHQRQKPREPYHPRHKEAKAGDPQAAIEVVRDTVRPEVVERLRQQLGGRKPIIVAVHAEESAGRNALPVAYAVELGRQLGLEVDMSIVQANAVHRTGKRALYRLANRAEFDGEVIPGREYLLVDDFLTLGGTLADLRAYIEAKGGKAIMATTLIAHQHSGPLASTPAQIAALRQAHPDIDEFWRSQYGYGIEGLTRSEASFLIRNPEAIDTLRSGGLAEGQAGEGGGNSPLASRLRRPETLDSRRRPVGAGPGLFDDLPAEDLMLVPEAAPRPAKPEQAQAGQLSFAETGDRHGQYDLLDQPDSVREGAPSEYDRAPAREPDSARAAREYSERQRRFIEDTNAESRLTDLEEAVEAAAETAERLRAKVLALEPASPEYAALREEWREATERLHELDNELHQATGGSGNLYSKMRPGSLPVTGLPDRTLPKVPKADIDQAIDHIRKIAKGFGVNVFEDLQSGTIGGQYAAPSPKFRHGRVRMNEAIAGRTYADTLSHEVGHALDSLISRAEIPGYRTYPGPSGNYAKLFGVDKPTALKIQAELEAVTRRLEGEAVDEDPAYYLSKKEMFARFMQAVMWHPAIVEDLAPTAFEALTRQGERFSPIADFIHVAKAGALEHPQAFYFLEDRRQGFQRKLGWYLGTKAYGQEILYRARRARAIQETAELIKAKFKGVEDDPAVLFDAAEGVKITKDGKPTFGTKMFKRLDYPEGVTADELKALSEGLVPTKMTPELKAAMRFVEEAGALMADGYSHVGIELDGRVLFEKWRKSPHEAEMAFNALSDEGKELIRQYTADASEATDLFNRNLIKETFGIESDLEGWVHHFFEDDRPKAWRRLFLKERKASAQLHRGEKEGYVKDLARATQKALTELRMAKEWNDFVHRQIAMVAQPLKEGADPRPGWVEVEGSVQTGFSRIGDRRLRMVTEDGRSFTVRQGKRYEVPAELYEQYRVERHNAEETTKMAATLERVNRYWQGNILLHPGSAMTNLISGGLQFGSKMLTDFYGELLRGEAALPRTRANVMGLLETLTPGGWRSAPDWVWGGDASNFYNQYLSAHAGGFVHKPGMVEGSIDVLLTGYQSMERFWKKAILNSEKRMSGGKAALDDPEFIQAVNDVIDLYAYDYQNIPVWLSALKRHPVGSGVKPFLTYPYKYSKMLASMAGGIFDRNLPVQDRIAKALALATIATAYGMHKAAQRREQEVGKVPPDAPKSYDEHKLKSAVNPRGRLYMADDRHGNEVYLRTAKYPFANAYDFIESALKSDTQGMRDITKDFIGSLGPIGEAAAVNVLGLRDEFDQYKPLSVINAEIGASFLPLGRMAKDATDALDPVAREPSETVGQVAGEHIPYEPARRMLGLERPPRVVKVPFFEEEGEDELTAAFGKEAVDRLFEEIGQGKNRTTIDVPAPKYREDAALRLGTGIILKRVNKDWYRRFQRRSIEHAQQAEEREALAE